MHQIYQPKKAAESNIHNVSESVTLILMSVNVCTKVTTTKSSLGVWAANIDVGFASMVLLTEAKYIPVKLSTAQYSPVHPSTAQ